MSDKQRQFDYDRGFAAGTAECETLRAQLAERDTLLIRALPDLYKQRFLTDAMAELYAHVAALSASAEPSAPKELKAPCKHVWEADGQCLFMCSLCGLETDCPVCVGGRKVASAKAGYVMDCPACCGEEG